MLIISILPSVTFAQPQSCAGIVRTKIIYNANGTYTIQIDYEINSNGFKSLNTVTPCGSICTNVQGSTGTVLVGPFLCEPKNSYIDSYTGIDCGGQKCQSSPVPVIFTDFSGKRLGNSVILNWATAMEIDNRGFSVEKKLTTSNDWQEIAFVASKAVGGNSGLQLSYSFIDLSGIGSAQYRIKQIDLNGVFVYTKIISIKSDNQSNITIYPNPSSGDIKVVFSDINLHTIQILDINGKFIQQIVTKENTLPLNLKPGMYIFKVLSQDGPVNNAKVTIL